MRSPDTPAREDTGIRGTPHVLHIALLDGFRGHTVVLTVDGREVYCRTNVTTDSARARADVLHIGTASRVARVAVSVNPGECLASLDVDVAASPHVAISLVGEGSVSLEASVRPMAWPLDH